MSTWSYSAYSASTRCLRLFKYQFLDKVKPDYESPDLAFGQAVHSGINALLTGEDAQAVFEIYWTAYQDKPVEWGRYSWGDLAKMGAEFLRKFQKSHASKYVLVVAEQRLRAEYGGITFEGSPDLYGTYEDKKALVDFKTTGSNYTQDKAFTSVQLNLYAYLLKQNGHDYPEVLIYQCFNKYTGAVQNPLIWSFSEDRMKEMLDSVVAQVTRIPAVDQDLYPQNFGACLDYNRRCPFWSKCNV